MSEEKENKLFPIFLKLENYGVLMVGGGKMAEEKLTAILENSPATHIRLVAKSINEEIRELQKKYPQLDILERAFLSSDLEHVNFLLIAVNDPVLSLAIKQEAAQRGIFTYVAHTPEQSDFYLGSVVQKGDLKIAISTNGKSPSVGRQVRETLEEAFPDEMQEVLDRLYDIRVHLSGDFTQKVKELNRITASLSEKKVDPSSIWKRMGIASLYSFAVITIMVLGHFLISYIPFKSIAEVATDAFHHFDPAIGLYILAGFVAQMIDGALGMAYGVSVTTFLLGLGLPAITPAVASASMHASEIFTTGSSSLVYMRYKNINKKLFQRLLWPGVIGAILGAVTISLISKQYVTIIKPLVALYTLSLGVIIIMRAYNVDLRKRSKIKKIAPVALTGGFLDSIGGGGWGPIVTTSLIAGGRNLRYAVGSSHLAKFFVAVISTATFIFLIGLSHWQIIFGLVIGGMIAAPISIYFSNKIPIRKGLLLVGCLVIIISLKTIITAFLK